MAHSTSLESPHPPLKIGGWGRNEREDDDETSFIKIIEGGQVHRPDQPMVREGNGLAYLSLGIGINI